MLEPEKIVLFSYINISVSFLTGTNMLFIWVFFWIVEFFAFAGCQFQKNSAAGCEIDKTYIANKNKAHFFDNSN